MLRRLHHEQPEGFEFLPANLAWAEAQITKYPEGRQASAIIPLLWRAQEQEGWLSRPAIEYVADFLDMDYIRALEVATFYFMFQLQPVGSVAHFQICGTLSCMIMGAEDLVEIAKKEIAPNPHQLSADGKFSWEEVECLGSCSNAPMAQVGKDYYEDLTTESFADLIARLGKGEVPVPGPQNGRYAAEPLSGLTSLTEFESGKTQYNASAQLAADIGDTVKRIDGTEVPLTAPWQGKSGGRKVAVKAKKAPAKTAPKTDAKAAPKAGAGATPAKAAADARAAKAKAAAPKSKSASKSAAKPAAASAPSGKLKKPRTMTAPRKAGADDLKQIKGVGPKLEGTLNALGFWHFDQIAKWTAEEVSWVDDNLSFKGRIERDGWIDQATRLAAGEETEFSKKVKKGGA